MWVWVMLRPASSRPLLPLCPLMLWLPQVILLSLVMLLLLDLPLILVLLHLALLMASLLHTLFQFLVHLPAFLPLLPLRSSRPTSHPCMVGLLLIIPTLLVMLLLLDLLLLIWLIWACFRSLLPFLPRLKVTALHPSFILGCTMVCMQQFRRTICCSHATCAVRLQRRTLLWQNTLKIYREIRFGGLLWNLRLETR
jgi:hypothetical protein